MAKLTTEELIEQFKAVAYTHRTPPPIRRG